MHILLIKTSSMGDLIHTLPALSDAGRAIPNICFDWVVEEPFAVIPTWHPLVNKVVPVALRKWRKGLFLSDTRAGWGRLRSELSKQSYDLIIDAQGLVKSAFLTFFARGKRVGLDFRSAREPLAAFAYQRRCRVNFYQHAVSRMRQLFSQALGYALPDDAPHFNLKQQQFESLLPAWNENYPAQGENYIIFLHGTTWSSKQWPETYWIQLGEIVAKAGYRIKISGGNTMEMERARRMAKQCSQIDVLPFLNIAEMAACLTQAKGVVAVDTGFGHLAAALDVPTVSIYGSTNPAYTGALGRASLHLAADFACAPCLNRICTYKDKKKDKSKNDNIHAIVPACYRTVKPAQVWQALMSLMFPR